MASASGSSDDTHQNGPTTRWEGYSNYSAVSQRVADSIDKAIDAYMRIVSMHKEGVRVQAATAAEARARILTAAIKLVPELEHDREAVDTYDEILDRWQDGSETGGRGYLSELASDAVSLQQACPEWLSAMMLDLRTAGWELGYLQAGRTTRTADDNRVRAEVDNMFGE